MRTLAAVVVGCLSLALNVPAQTPPVGGQRPLRVVIAGLVHGHVSGFLDHCQHRTDLEIGGIAEPNRQLAEQYAGRYKLEQRLFYADLEDAIQKTRTDGVLVYTNMYDHRRVVEL
jgi:predicted dehydrogenase